MTQIKDVLFAFRVALATEDLRLISEPPLVPYSLSEFEGAAQGFFLPAIVFIRFLIYFHVRLYQSFNVVRCSPSQEAAFGGRGTFLSRRCGIEIADSML